MVQAGESGVLAWPLVPAAGVYAYPVTLSRTGGAVIEQRGKVSIVR
jgi:hypothetical protein